MIEAIKVQDSFNPFTESRITSFEWEYPRMIHAELLTHREFNRNSGSSRAIPVMSAIDIARDKMFTPVFRYNQKGMQPGEQLSKADMEVAVKIWRSCAYDCIEAAKELASIKVHKQWANRMLEWFSPIKIICTSTQFDNFLWLRNDFEAQDELAMLAEQVERLLRNTKPESIEPGHIHAPYVNRTFEKGQVIYSNSEGELTIPQALKVSASMAGQMSYRKGDDSIAKAEDMYERFIRGRRVHASPFEHQAIATYDKLDFIPLHLDAGITHFDRQNRWYSGSLRGWVQYRQLIKDNVCKSLPGAREL